MNGGGLWNKSRLMKKVRFTLGLLQVKANLEIIITYPKDVQKKELES